MSDFSYLDELNSFNRDYSGSTPAATGGSGGLDRLLGRIQRPRAAQYGPAYSDRLYQIGARGGQLADPSPFNSGTRLASSNQDPYQPPGPPIRWSVGLLGGADDATRAMMDSPIGVVGFGQPGAQRGGSIDVGPLKVATTPVNFANFATYAREAPLSVITSAMGHAYQPDENGVVRGPDEAHQTFLDHFIDGVNTIGDAVNAPFAAFGDWFRKMNAQDRVNGFADIVKTGGGTGGTWIARATSLFDQSRFSWQGIADKARAQGMDFEQMAAELWDLPPDVARAIMSNPGMSPDALNKLAAGQGAGLPYSNSSFVNMGLEATVMLAPLLVGAGEIRGGGFILKGLAGAASRIGIGKVAGAATTSLRELGVLGNATKTAEAIGMWTLPKAYRTIKMLEAANRYSLMAGSGIRFGEWALKQAAVIGGNEEAIHMMDEWLWEMPLSTNPGLQLADAFAVHPLRTAKAIPGAIRHPVQALQGEIDRLPGRRGVTIAGIPDPVMLSRADARRAAVMEAMPLELMQRQFLDRLEFDHGETARVFGEGGELTPTDLKNGLLYLAAQIVRERKGSALAHLEAAGTQVERTAAFWSLYGSEALKLLEDNLAGRSSAIVDAFKGEFWERQLLVDGSELGVDGMVGPYSGPAAFIRFRDWMRASKAMQALHTETDLIVPGLRTDINQAFVADYKTTLRNQYPNHDDLVTADDINLLKTYVPAIINVRGGARLGRAGDRVPKIKRSQLEKILDTAIAEENEARLRAADAKVGKVAAIAPESVGDVNAEARAMGLVPGTLKLVRDVVEGKRTPDAGIPADLGTILKRVYRMNEAEMRRSPERAWQLATDWYTEAYQRALDRGQGMATLKQIGTEFSRRPGNPAQRAGDDAAIARITNALNEPLAHDAAGAADPVIERNIEARNVAITDFVDRSQAWLQSDLVGMTVEPFMDTVMLTSEKFTRGDPVIFGRMVAQAETVVGMSELDLATLADNTIHPLDKVTAIRHAVDLGLGLSKVQQRILDEAPSLEDAFGEQIARAYGPETPVNGESVLKLTNDVAGRTDELEGLRMEARGLGDIVQRAPGAALTDSLRDFYSRAEQLGSVQAGVRGGPRIARWRSLPVDLEGIRAVNAQAAVDAQRVELVRRLEEAHGLIRSFDQEAAKIAAADGQSLGPADFTWEPQPERYALKRDAIAAAKQLRDDTGQASLVTKVSSTRWGISRGTLIERPPEPVWTGVAPENAPGAPPTAPAVPEPTPAAARAPAPAPPPEGPPPPPPASGPVEAFVRRGVPGSVAERLHRGLPDDIARANDADWNAARWGWLYPEADLARGEIGRPKVTSRPPGPKPDWIPDNVAGQLRDAEQRRLQAITDSGEAERIANQKRKGANSSEQMHANTLKDKVQGPIYSAAEAAKAAADKFIDDTLVELIRTKNRPPGEAVKRPGEFTPIEGGRVNFDSPEGPSFIGATAEEARARYDEWVAGGRQPPANVAAQSGLPGERGADARAAKITADAAVNPPMFREPVLNEPVVIDGVKYRIKSWGLGGEANLRQHFKPNLETTVNPRELTWDQRAGVWRHEPAAGPDPLLEATAKATADEQTRIDAMAVEQAAAKEARAQRVADYEAARIEPGPIPTAGMADAEWTVEDGRYSFKTKAEAQAASQRALGTMTVRRGEVGGARPFKGPDNRWYVEVKRTPLGASAPPELPFKDPMTGAAVQTRPVLVDADVLTTSADDGFPMELQPRARGIRTSSDTQIAKIVQEGYDPATAFGVESGAEGMPVATAAGDVVAGNGRMMAVRTMDDARFASYRDALPGELARYGIDPAAAETMRRPVLVRELVNVDETTMRRLAWQLNMSTELPIGDLLPAFARDLTPAIVNKFEIREGESIRDALARSGNDAFVNDALGLLPEINRKRFIEGSQLSKAGYDLLGGALIAKVLRADDRGLPTFDAANRVLYQMFETGDPDIARIAGGLAEGGGALARVQNLHEQGLGVEDFPRLAMDLVPVIDDILRQRREDVPLRDIAGAAEAGFSQITLGGTELTPIQARLTEVLAGAQSQQEIAAFLRGVAKSASPEENVMFVAEGPTGYIGILNDGIAAVNGMRARTGRTQLRPFASEAPPFDTALTKPKLNDDGSVSPPIVESQPVPLEEIGNELGARIAGEDSPHVFLDNPAHVGEAVKAIEQTTGPVHLSSTDPALSEIYAAWHANPEGLRAAYQVYVRAFYESVPEERQAAFDSLRIDINAGRAEPAEVLFFHELVGNRIRRNVKGEINNRRLPANKTTVAQFPAWLDSLEPLRDRIRVGETEAKPGVNVLMPSEKRHIEPDALHAITGDAVPAEPVMAGTEAIAQSADHTVLVDQNAAISNAVRKATGAPVTRNTNRTMLEFNAPNLARRSELLDSLRLQAEGRRATTEADLAEFDRNPPPTEVPAATAFVDPVIGGLYRKLMGEGQGEGLDPGAPAMGAAEPRSLGEIADALESLDRGIHPNLTPNEAGELRGALFRMAEATLASTGRRFAEGRSASLAARITPRDFDAQGLADRTKLVEDTVAQLVTHDPSAPALAGYSGTQYIPVKPRTVDPATGERLAPRLALINHFGDEVIPGLADELAMGRMQTIPRRIEQSRAYRLIDAIAGSRSEQEIRSRAIQNFENAIIPEGLMPAEYDAARKLTHAIFAGWREEQEQARLIGPFTTFRRVSLLGPDRLNRIAGQVIDREFKGNPPDWVSLMQLHPGGFAGAWRIADNRIRMFMRESGSGIAHGLERLYGVGADLGEKPGRAITVMYHTIRFLGDIRWLGLESIEAPIYAASLGGPRAVVEGIRGTGKAPLAFGTEIRGKTLANYAHWLAAMDPNQSMPVRIRFLLRTLAAKQGRPFREAVLQMAREEPGLAATIAHFKDTPEAWLERMDRDFALADSVHQPLGSEAEAISLFKPFLDAGVIDDVSYRQLVKARRYTPQPAIQAELDRVVGDPTAVALYSRLQVLNQQMFNELAHTFFGQPDRSNLQRLANHPFLFWPISYQIKATKWLLGTMLEGVGNVDTGATVGVAFQRVWDQHRERMRTDPAYRAQIADNNTLLFIAGMLLPITPMDIGVSLSPFTRMLVDPEYSRQGGIFSWGPFYTYQSLLPRLVREQTQPGGALYGTPVADRAQQAFPYSIRVDPTKTKSELDAAQQAALGPGPVQMPADYNPEVPRLP